jgi:hypothetical protein
MVAGNGIVDLPIFDYRFVDDCRFLIGDSLLICRNQQSEIINHQFNQYSKIQDR